MTMEAPPYDSVFQPDTLPSYRPSINVTGRLLVKQELEKPDTPALLRHWRRVEAEIRGTTLLLFDISGKKPGGLEASAKHCRSYTLQAGDVGLASDYKQRLDALRIRVEGEQLLCLAPGVGAAVAWVESLLTAIAISDPLEDWKMPRYPKLPTRGSKLLGQSVGDGFGRRLWSELAWHGRERREWLFEAPSRTRKERWKEIVHGPGGQPRRNSTSSTTSSQTTPDSGGRSNSVSSRCQCPCSSCWRQEARRASIQSEAEQALAKDANFDGLRPSLQHSVGYAPTLAKWAAWKSRHYIKNGHRFNTPPRPAWLENPGQPTTWPDRRSDPDRRLP